MRRAWWLGSVLLLCLCRSGAQPAADKLDINTASPAQLASLPGMGQEYARRVIAGRPYRAKNQLSSRGVIPDEEYRRIADLIVAKRPAANNRAH